MSKKSKANWQALRRRYTWHLRPPFANAFDRSHWWNGQSKIEPAAALYELARRHPLVRANWLVAVAALKRNQRGLSANPGHACFGQARFSHLASDPTWFRKNSPFAGRPPVSLYMTSFFSLKSWTQVDSTDREWWKDSVGLLKGLDFRSKEVQCPSINELAERRIRFQRGIALRDKVRGEKGLNIVRLVTEDILTNPRTVEEWEAAIAHEAVGAFREGYLLLAIAPDLRVEKAASLVAKVYAATRHRHGRPKPRARFEDWLPLIAAFEDEETTQKAYSQTFARYRRALDRLRFA